MNKSLYTGFAGSLSNYEALGIIGDNVANIDTNGFKRSDVSFANLFESALNTASNQPVISDVGNGSRVSASALDTSQGAFKSSENTFDMAIEGNGWFGVSSSNLYNSRDIAYTRNGNFSVDANENIVNSDGKYLLGFDYKNIIQKSDGTFEIDTSKNITTPVAKTDLVTKLQAKKELYYPSITTTEAKLVKNLYTQNPNQISSASGDTPIEALLDNNAKLINLKEEQNIFLNIGSQKPVFKQSHIIYDFTTPSATEINQSSISFDINQKTITLNLDATDDKNSVANKVASAINDSNVDGISATVKGNKIELISDKNLKIQNSSVAFLENTDSKILTYSTTKSSDNNFATLDDLVTIMSNSIKSIYNNSDNKVFLDSSGKIKVLSGSDNIKLNFLSANNTNKAFLDMLNPLNSEIAPNTYRFSNNFNIAKTSSAVKIVDENGNKQLLNIDFIQTKPQSGDGATWQSAIQIQNYSTLDKTTDFQNILKDNNKINLKQHQDMWISIGNGDIQKKILGYDYTFEAPSLLSKTTSSNISFKVNNNDIKITLEAGLSKNDVAITISKALNNAGIDASAIDGIVKIKADINSKSLTISNYSGDIDGFEIKSHALLYASYGDDFTTVKEFEDLFNQTASKINSKLSLSDNDAKLVFTNNDKTQISFKFLDGIDSNKDFLNLITPTNDPLGANKSSSTTKFDTLKTLTQTTKNLTFDNTSSLKGDTSFVIKNGNKDLKIDLSGMTNLDENLYNEYFSQNGEIASHITNYTISDAGEIIANFSNNKSVAISQIPLFHFQNEQGLDKIGSNLFIRSQNSGESFFYSDANGNYSTGSSAIKNKMLESSNVTTLNALTQMIVIQRAFEGTAKIITTSNELLKNAINMKK